MKLNLKTLSQVTSRAREGRKKGDGEGEVEADGGEGGGEDDEQRTGEAGRERRCCRGDRREG